MLKVKVISLPYIFQVLYVLCFTGSRYQVSVYRTNGPLVYSGLIRNLVAMATCIFYRLIMGKVKIDNFFCLNGWVYIVFGIYFYRNVYLVVPYVSWLLSKSLNFIGCQNDKKGKC